VRYSEAVRSPLIPFLIAAAVTILIGVGVRMEPYFAGDVAVTRAVQRWTPAPTSWATPVSRLAPAPGKYYVMAIALVASFFVAGFRGLAVVVCFLLLEQYGAELTKPLFNRPRPSRDLIAVVGNPSGLSFPSTTITFYSVTIGAVGLLALMRKKAPYRWPVVVIGFGFLLLGCIARVALGAHWPSDVLLTSLLCLVWIWAASRLVLSKG
jgi:membrane-associated phospholipid phosphatase